MDYIQNLVCPKCKSSLERENDSIRCKTCKTKYPMLDGIPIFCEQSDYEKWTQYHIDVFTPILTVQNKKKPLETPPTCDQDNYLSLPLSENDYYSKFVERCDRVLDLGSGEGVFSAPLSSKVKEIYCVDPSYIALKRVIKRNKHNIYPINCSGDNLPFPDNFFDYVLFIFVIEHIQDPQPILSEIRRILKPNGHLIVSTDSRYYYRYSRVMIEMLKYRKYRADDPTHINLMTPRELRDTLKRYFSDDFEEIHYFVSDTKVKCIPQIISEPFLSALMIHKCKPKQNEVLGENGN